MPDDDVLQRIFHSVTSWLDTPDTREDKVHALPRQPPLLRTRYVPLLASTNPQPLHQVEDFIQDHSVLQQEHSLHCKIRPNSIN